MTRGGLVGETQARFCNACGAPFAEGQTFCTKCGSQRASVTMRDEAQAAGAVPAQAAAPAFVAQASAATATARTAYGTVAQAAGAAGMAVSLPWQTIVAGQQPDIRAFLSAAALPAAHQAVRASLKRPGIAMAITTTLDLVVAGITGGTGALVAAIPRVLLGGATALFSLITGSKGGPLRKLTGAISAVTAVVQLGYTGWTLVGGLVGGTPVLTLLPMVIAMTSSLVMAVKTVLLAFRTSR